MADTVDKATRSKVMSRIRGKDTQPEMQLRRALHARGLRFRLHSRDLPGSPDIVFPRHRAVVFVHGCFWHRHSGCPLTTTPSTRPEFWNAKFKANMARDAATISALLEDRWRVLVVWECALKRRALLPRLTDKVVHWLAGDDTFLELGRQIGVGASGTPIPEFDCAM